MVFLGIDYGTKKIGIALSDREGMIAFPKRVVPHTDELFDALEGVIASEGVAEIVVGESKDLSGKENKVMDEIRIFVKELENRFHLPVHLEQEFMTSLEARRGGTREEMVDASAAALILQRFLEKHQNTR
jgi:putative Holliday junction resolvase